MARPSSRPPITANSAESLLDELLPIGEPEGMEVHTGAAVLEVAEPAQLLELASDPALRPLLLCRLSPTAALVDPGGSEQLLEVLRRRGHTPKVLRD
jgi:hypothetical protein